MPRRPTRREAPRHQNKTHRLGRHAKFLGDSNISLGAKAERGSRQVLSITAMKPSAFAVVSGEFLREHIQSVLSSPVIGYSSVSELEGQFWQVSPDLVIFSLMQSNEASVSALKVLLGLAPTVPVIVLASIDDMERLRAGVAGQLGSYARARPIKRNANLVVTAPKFLTRLDIAAPLSST